MFKIVLLICGLSFVASLKVKTQLNPITQQNHELFKYSPNDKYTLPENIDDDDDKTPVHFTGDVQTAKTVEQSLNQGKGKYKLNLETQNGIKVTQVGKLKDDKTFVVSGSYSYTGADGRKYRVRYTADELGYHPITELDVDTPELEAPQAAPAAKKPSFGKLSGSNKFQFLNKKINNEPALVAPLKDDGYSYTVGNGVSASAGNIGAGGFGGNFNDNTQFGGNNAFNTHSSASASSFGQSNGHNQGLNGAANYEDHSQSGYEYLPPSREYLPSAPSGRSFNYDGY